MKLLSPAALRAVNLARLVLAAALAATLLLASLEPLLELFLGLVFGVYFLFAGTAWWLERRPQPFPLARWAFFGDAAALGIVLLFAPNLPGAFLLFFLYFAYVAGLTAGGRVAAALSLVVVAVYFLLALRWTGEPITIAAWLEVLRRQWMKFAGLVTAATLVGFIGQRERARQERAQLIERFAELLRLGPDWPLLWRRWLAALAGHFRAGRALLAWRDPEADRLLLWQWGEDGRPAETARPPRDLQTFLPADDALFLWVAAARPESRRQALRRFFAPPLAISARLPERFVEEFRPASAASAPFRAGEDGSGRLFLLDARAGGFSLSELEELEQVLAGLGPVLANLLAVRAQVERGVNQERERVVRDLHDSVAQTLSSLEMQLQVLPRLLAAEPQRVSEELARLQSVLRQEKEDFRRYLRELKPVRIAPDELGRWVVAHCAQFQQETGVEVDVASEPLGGGVPEGVCREIFLILREALHNIRKHAGAKRVVVRLLQSDSFLRLRVDDDGRGFPFSGTYSLSALEEQGLAPASLAERTRALGGALTIDSTPGSGSTLRIDIPLS